jgi:hypothetical protein
MRRRWWRWSVRHGYYGCVCGLSSVPDCIGDSPRRVVPVASGVAVNARFSAVFSGFDSDSGSGSGRSWGSVVELDKDDGRVTFVSWGETLQKAMKHILDGFGVVRDRKGDFLF